MDSNGRTKLAMGFTLIAGVLALASVAFACAVFKGTMTFTTPLSSTTVTGYGYSFFGGEIWCGGDPAPGSVETSVTQTLGIMSGPSTQCTPSQLVADSYTVAWVKGYMPGSPNSSSHINCHPELSPTVMGTYTVDETGNGSPNAFTWAPVGHTTGNPNVKVRGYVNVCVFRGTAADPLGPQESPDGNSQNFRTV